MQVGEFRGLGQDDAVNPYQKVTESMIAKVEEAFRSIIGPSWDGKQHPKELLAEIAGAELAGEYLRAVREFMKWREHFGHPSREYLFRIGSIPPINQFLHRWQANSLVDRLLVLAAITSAPSSENAPICELGCGLGLVTAAIGKLVPNRVIGFDLQRYWEQISDDFPIIFPDNVEFVQRDVINQPASEAFDILYADGIREHCDSRRFWEAVNNWCRPNGFVLTSGGIDAVSAATLLEMCDGISGLWPVACVPTGGPPNDYLPHDPGTLVICQRIAPLGDLSAQCHRLVAEYREYCARAQAYLDDEAIPYQQKTFAKCFLHN